MPDVRLTQFNGIDLFDEPVDRILEIINKKMLPKLSYIVTPNADHFYRLSEPRNSDFIAAYANADLRICDSRIIQKLSFAERHRIRNVIPGSDLTHMIVTSEWASKLDLLIVGPEPHELEVIRHKFFLPNLKGYTPPMGFIRSEAEVRKCIDVIKKSQADIVFLAVGSPQQELLAHRIKQTASDAFPKGTVILCIGASFDFLSGKIKRAPIMLQKLHLEWLHRALSNPSRLIPRYWKNFRWVLFYLLKR
ncbi:putative N-acetylmannosaminyltransferase [compost metagenome]